MAETDVLNVLDVICSASGRFDATVTEETTAVREEYDVVRTRQQFV